MTVGILVLCAGEQGRHSNGFTRKFEAIAVHKIASTPLPATIRNINGIAGGSIYFETDDPALIYRADSNLKKLQPVHLPVQESEALTSLFITGTDSPFVFIAGGNIPVLIRLNTNTSAIEYNNFPRHTFTRCVRVSENSFIFRMYKRAGSKWNQVFAKSDIKNNSLTEEKDISPKTDDAGFATDGLLHFDKITSKLVYVHYYNNTVMCMDTNLNLLYTMHTIDTSLNFSVSAGKHTTGYLTEYTNTNPLRNINLQSCIYDGKLFINSNVKADNEKQKSFKDNAVIDVYSINDKAYKGSFYIPAYKGELLNTFKINRDRLYALYSGHVILYRVSL